MHSEEVGRDTLLLVNDGITSDTRTIGRVGDGDSLGVLVLGVMLLGMDLLVLLEVLRPFEWLLADYADVRFEWGMDWARLSLAACERRTNTHLGGDW